MTNEDLKKLEKISNLIRTYERFYGNIDTIRIGFGLGSSTDLFLTSENSLLRKQDVIDTIHSAVRDTLDDLQEQYNSIVLCTKETSTKYKPLELK